MSTTTFLTREQVTELNEKHGYFQSADAQGDVSRAFAQDAIALHERIRAHAQPMLEALRRFEVAANTAAYCYANRPENFAAALEDLSDAADTARALRIDIELGPTP